MHGSEFTTSASRSVRRDFRLIIQGSTWRQACRQLLLGDFQFAAGRLRWHNTPQAHELLCDKLNGAQSMPSGSRFSPSADWLCVTLVPGRVDLEPRPVGRLLRSLAPRANQTVALVVLARSDPTHWSAIIRHAQATCWVARVDIVGPRMVQLESIREQDQSNARWSRTVGALGAPTHQRLRTATVTVVGCGRNGLLAAQYVASLGVRHLRLLDPDELRMENLDAMPCIPTALIGRPKTEAVAKLLRAFRPDLRLSLSAADAMSPDGCEFLAQRSDLLISCVDNDAARLAVARTATRTITVHLDVATSVQRDPETLIRGDARLLLPGHGCVVCVGGMADLQAAMYELDAPPGSLPLRPPQAWHEERAGSLLTINVMTVSAGVQMWLDLIAGTLRNSFWQRLRWHPGGAMQVDGAAVDRATDCEFCGR